VKQVESRRWFDKVRNKILAVAVISSFVPILLLSGVIVSKLKKDLVVQALTSQKTFSNAVSNGLDVLMSSFISQLEMLAALPEIQGMEKDAQMQAMHNFFDFNPVFYSIIIYDADSVVLSAAYRNREEKQQTRYLGRHLLSGVGQESLPTRKGYQRVMESKKPMVADTTIMVQGEQMLLVFVPIFDFIASDKIIGIVSCAINLNGPEMMEFISGYETDKDEIMLLTDYEGKLLAGQGEALPEGLTEMNAFELAYEFEDTTTVEFQLEGNRYIGIISPVRSLNGYLIAAKSSSKIFGFLHSMFLDLGIIVIVAMLMAGVFGYIISKHLALKINLLVEGIKRVAAGVLSHRVEISGSDELSEAGGALNAMIDSLEKNRMLDVGWNELYNHNQPASNPESSHE
jgi:HAMP domain-containing protein